MTKARPSNICRPPSMCSTHPSAAHGVTESGAINRRLTDQCTATCTGRPDHNVKPLQRHMQALRPGLPDYSATHRPDAGRIRQHIQAVSSVRRLRHHDARICRSLVPMLRRPPPHQATRQQNAQAARGGQTRNSGGRDRMRGVVCGQMLVWLTRQKYAEPEQHPIAAGNDNPDVQGPPYPALILSDNGRTFTLRLFAHNGYADTSGEPMRVRNHSGLPYMYIFVRCRDCGSRYPYMTARPNLMIYCPPCRHRRHIDATKAWHSRHPSYLPAWYAAHPRPSTRTHPLSAKPASVSMRSYRRRLRIRQLAAEDRWSNMELMPP